MDDKGPRIGWYYPWGYAESSGTWPTTPTDSFTGSGSERLGFSVALSADGQTALVGAPNAGSGGAAYLYDNCAAFLYAEPASGWTAVPSPVATFTGTGRITSAIRWPSPPTARRTSWGAGTASCTASPRSTSC